MNINRNKFEIGGRLAATPELKRTANGLAYTNVRVITTTVIPLANGETRDETVGVDISVAGKMAEVICQYGTKGAPVNFDNLRFESRKYEDADGNTRYWNGFRFHPRSEFTLIESKAERLAREARANQAAQQAAAPIPQEEAPLPSASELADEIPF